MSTDMLRRLTNCR